ncbi:MAG: hypothetical protein ABI293_01430 [Rhodanobacter sp.]
MLTRLITENDSYQDWEARHARVERDRKHVRIFPYAQNAAEAEKRERKDLATREYELLREVRHEHILSPGQLTESDQTSTVVWRATDDINDLVKVGEQTSLTREGLFGYIQSQTANRTKYGIYIVTPGSYDLVGLTYDLAHSSLPALSSKHWVASPKLGMASFAITRDAEFNSHQA